MKDQELLLYETRKRMQQLYEYSFYHGVKEDSEEQDNNSGPNAPGAGPNAPGGDPNAPGGDPNAMGGDPNAMGGDPNAPGGGPNAIGGDPNDMGGDPSAMGGDPNAPGGGPNAPGGDPNAMGGDPNAMGGDPNAMGGDPNVMGGDPNAMGGDPNVMGDQPGPDDDVIDITQLTDAQDEMKANQERTAEQLEDVDSKLITLLKVVDKFTKALNANDEKINDLKREIQMRTPTEEETMNVRLHAGGNPFDKKPEEFWSKFKDINNHYNITSNNEAPIYQITKGQIDNANDSMINRDFDDEFDDIPHTLHEYFVR